MNDPEVADLLRKLAREAQALRTYFYYLLLSDSALAIVHASAIRDVTARLAMLSCTMEWLARSAESEQGLPLRDEFRSP